MKSKKILDKVVIKFSMGGCVFSSCLNKTEKYLLCTFSYLRAATVFNQHKASDEYGELYSFSVDSAGCK